MTRDSAIEEADLLLVDGDNLLHGVRGSRDEAGVAWLLPRLSRWRPEHLRIIVALDGHPAPGETRRKRATRGIEFHHSGSGTADDLLIELLSAQPYAGRSRTVLVTGDRVLRDRARRAGGTTRSVDWLVQRVATSGGGSSSASVGIGQGSPPPRRSADAGADDDVERGWSPGRGATRKRGNPRRSPKRARRR